MVLYKTQKKKIAKFDGRTWKVKNIVLVNFYNKFDFQFILIWTLKKLEIIIFY